jgi:hypothetical protein
MNLGTRSIGADTVLEADGTEGPAAEDRQCRPGLAPDSALAVQPFAYCGCNHAPHSLRRRSALGCRFLIVSCIVASFRKPVTQRIVHRITTPPKGTRQLPRTNSQGYTNEIATATRWLDGI